MVRETILQLEEAFSNVGLLNQGPSGVKEYFDTNFNFLEGLYMGQNIRHIHKHLAFLDNPLHDQGREDHNMFNAFVAYVPDIDDEKYVRWCIFSDYPELKPMGSVNFESRIKELTSNSHDGAILWNENYISNNYVAFTGLGSRAAHRARKMLGTKGGSLVETIMPLIEPALYGPDGKRLTTMEDKPQTLGTKTLNGACLPLAIPGAVSFVLKSTVYKYGAGRILMFNSDGLAAEGYVDRDGDLPPELYLVKDKKLAIVRKDYRFDRTLGKVVLRSKTYLNPHDLGLSDDLLDIYRRSEKSF